MSGPIPHRISPHPQVSSRSPSLVHSQRSVLFLFSLLVLVLCALPACSSSLSSSIRSSSASSSSSAPDVWSPATPTPSTGRTDVWPPVTSTGGSEDRPIPDTTSALRCEALELDPALTFNQSVLCTIECKTEMSATAGKVSDYEWSSDDVNGPLESVELSLDWSPHERVPPASSTSQVKFGSVSNFTSYNDSKVIAFVYTAPAQGSTGVLHVLAARGAEIENSPIIFTLNAPPESDNSTTPIVVPPATPSTSTSFVSLSNPAFIGVCAVALVLMLSAVLGGVWAHRVFARKADEVRERQASEAQWAHSVPSLKARLNVPQPSTNRSPLLR